MRVSWLFAASLLFAVGNVFCASSVADEPGLTQRHHFWGHFQPGAWKLVRVKTEVFDDESPLNSVTETKTTLSDVDDVGVTLLVEASVMVGGKRLSSDPQSICEGFHGELASNSPQVTSLGPGEVVIENRRVACQIVQLEYPRTAGRKVSKVYYTDVLEPYILRRETATYGTTTEEPISETVVEVVALEAPCRLFRSFRSAARLKSVRKDSSGTTTTWAWTSSLVPGGVIHHTSEQVDTEGRLIRRSSLELLDYGLQEPTGRSGLFWRWRSSRNRPSH